MAVVPRIGTEFAGYRIEALLGRGGMSVVYRAENARLGNKVALKLLAESLADDESFRERFVRESRTAAALNHPNIVSIYDAGDWDGVLYIAMRWVDGDLKDHLKRTGPLAPDHALAIAAQIGSALDAAHARGLLHRDVKPANILLELGEPSSEPLAYLADFGLTKHLESRSGITASGQFVGTIDYMSPEQIEGHDVDARTDIYSLGCVVFESLAGATPFRRETEVAVLWAHMRDDPPPLTEVRPDLPPLIDAVIAKAMAKQPEERYATCREFVADLRHALGAAAAETYAGRTVVNGDGQSAGPTVAEPRAARPARRGRRGRRVLRALAGIGAVLLAGVAGAAVYELVRDVKPRIIATSTSPIAFDSTLLSYIPIGIEYRCQPMDRLTPDFSSSVSCPLANRAVARVEYHRAESGEKMRQHFERRASAEGLATLGKRFQPRRHCGMPPALREWRRTKGPGHEAVQLGEEPSGRFMCYRHGNWAAIEWTDQDIDVYSIAYGRDMSRLFDWWTRRAGPVPAD